MEDKNILSLDNIILNSKLHCKEEVIDKLFDILVDSGAVLDKKMFIEDIYERESRGFTFAGDYLAIPHSFSHCVAWPQIAIIRTNNAFVWDENENLVKLVIMLAIPESTEREKELEILKNIVYSLGDVNLVKDLLEAKTKEELIKLIYSYADNQ